MNQVHSHKVGLVVAGLFAIIHAIWSIMVLVGLAEKYLDWIFGLHFLNIAYAMEAFSLGNAILLVIVTAIIVYIFGYILGWLWNMAHRASHQR